MTVLGSGMLIAVDPCVLALDEPECSEMPSESEPDPSPEGVGDMPLAEEDSLLIARRFWEVSGATVDSVM